MPPMTTPQIPMAPVIPIMPMIPPMFPLKRFKHNFKHTKEGNMLFYIYMLFIVVLLFIIGSVSTGSSTFTQIPMDTLKNNEDLIFNISEERVYINTTDEESAQGFNENRNKTSVLSISEKENVFAGLTMSNLLDVNLGLNKYNVTETGVTDFEDSNDIAEGNSITKIKGYSTLPNGKKIEVGRLEVTTNEFILSVKSPANVYNNRSVNPCIRIDNLGRLKGNLFQPSCIGAQGTSKIVKGDADGGLKPDSKNLIINNFNLIDQNSYNQDSNANYKLPKDNIEVGDFVVFVIGGTIDIDNYPINIMIDDNRTFGLGSTILNKSLFPTSPRLQIVGYYPNADPVNNIKINSHSSTKDISNLIIKFTFMNNIGFQDLDNKNETQTKTWCFEGSISDQFLDLSFENVTQ